MNKSPGIEPTKALITKLFALNLNDLVCLPPFVANQWQQTELICGKTVGVKLKGAHDRASLTTKRLTWTVSCCCFFNWWIGWCCVRLIPYSVWINVQHWRSFITEPTVYLSIGSLSLPNRMLFNCSLLLPLLGPESFLPYSLVFFLKGGEINQTLSAFYISLFCTTSENNETTQNNFTN